LISQSGINLLNIILIIVSLLTSLLYVAWLSLPAFVLMTIALALGIIQMIYQQEVHDAIQMSILKERKFLNQLSQVLEGFKEIKINDVKSEGLFQHIKRTSVETQKIKINVGRQFIAMSTSLRSFYHVLLGAMVFLLPMLNLVEINELFQLVVITIFITRPMDGLADYIPIVTRANAAIENIQGFERELDEQLQFSPDYGGIFEGTELTNFNEIQLDTVVFHYTTQTGDQHLFSIGPLSFKLKKGETVFIIGGNGSGKSTLLKLLIGLYYPLSGHLILDGEKIDEYTYPQYRSLFSTVFSDFYLFNQFYGLSQVDEKKLKYFLDLMELNQKIQYQNGQFTHTHLSTGQRKRLALVMALMEDKPIYLFDEWAADQDPIFRTFFYQVLLKDLKAQGKTVIAVTHDDRYFSVADRVIKMEEGQLIQT
jgi:putative ATP-binding cassette transporter